MRRKSILEMSHEEAKKFFLKDKSYCNIDLPEYFSFAKLLGCTFQIEVQQTATFFMVSNL